MFSLQKLLGKDDKFFELLEAGADEAQASVTAIVKIVRQPANLATLEDFVLSRRKEKRISERISEELVKTFVTGLEREDIESLSIALYKIPKAAEKFAERYILAAPHLEGADFSRQAALLESAAETVRAMVRHLRQIQNLEAAKTLNDKLQVTEGEADRLILEQLRELYSGKHDALRVVMLKDLYELLEKVIDRCRDAGNVISHIFLKNS